MYRTKTNSTEKHCQHPGGGAPLEAVARWLGHPSLYCSLAPDLCKDRKKKKNTTYPDDLKAVQSQYW